MIGKIIVYLIALLSIGSMLAMYAWALFKIMPVFAQAGLESILLGVALLASMVMIFFMGFFYLIGFLYFAKDTELLFSMPIPQRTIFASKFSQVLFGEMGVAIALLLPAFVIYGVQNSVDILYWIRVVPTVLLTPFIPLALSGILALLLMRFNALWRRRDLLTVIGSILLIVAVFAVQILPSAVFDEEMTQAEMMALVFDQSSLLSSVVSAFPPSGWAAEGLLLGGSKLLLFCLSSITSLIILLFLSHFIYQRGATAQTESSRKNRTVQISCRTMKARSVTASYFKKEWILMLRSPTYALNGLVLIFVGPMMIIFMALTNGASGGQLDPIFDLIQSAIDWRLATLYISAFFLLVATLNTSVSTSVSREGKQFYLLRMFPLPAKKQAFAKFLMGYSVNAITVLLMALALYLILPIPVPTLLFSIATGFIASVAPTALSMIPDLFKPKLDWNTETEAIKQNANTMIAMAVGLLYVAALGFFSYLLLRAETDAGLVLGIDLAISAAAGALSVWALGKIAKRSFIRMEG